VAYALGPCDDTTTAMSITAIPILGRIMQRAGACPIEVQLDDYADPAEADATQRGLGILPRVGVRGAI
jgi:hypothetical protein